MIGYKHVHKDYAGAFKSGASIKIGTLGHYRQQEGPRADPGEGIVIWNIPADRPIGLDSRLPGIEDVGSVSQMGIRVNGCTNSQFSNLRARKRARTAYIFCCSDRPDFKLARRHNLEIFRIDDLEAFARRLTRDNGRHLGRPVVRPVIYSNKMFDPRDGLLNEPFLKARKFAFEREIRIAWEPRSLIEEWFLAKSSKVKTMITPVAPLDEM